MARAVAQCHGMDVMLRDIKPENVRPRHAVRQALGSACLRPLCRLATTMPAPSQAQHPPTHSPARPQFMFLDSQPGSPLKAIDFGISVFCRPGQHVDVRAGTPIYIAPEVLRMRYTLSAGERPPLAHALPMLAACAARGGHGRAAGSGGPALTSGMHGRWRSGGCPGP